MSRDGTAERAVARRRGALGRIVVGFLMVFAVVAMHSVVANTISAHHEHASHDHVLVSQSSDNDHCGHDSPDRDGCDSVGMHACKAILLNPDAGISAPPLAGWVEPILDDETIRITAQRGAWLRGPPPRGALSRAELSIWRL